MNFRDHSPRIVRVRLGVVSQPILVWDGDCGFCAWVDYVPVRNAAIWQMWFAALGNYRDNPWVVNLMFRLLRAHPML